jgi:tetrapyrrole methylase family protein/MazG family protein
VINLCRFFDISPDTALQRTNTKFIERFKYVEKRMKESCQEMTAKNLAVMDQYWNEAK